MSYAFFKQKYPDNHKIPITLFHPVNWGGKSTSLKCAVDTGSWSIFPANVLQDLGIDVTKGYHYYDNSETGERKYLHRLPIQFGGGNPVLADIYFGDDVASSYVWQPGETLGHIGWANNGGLNNYIIDYQENNVGFTDFSYINSLPNPTNKYTILKLNPPRLVQRYSKIILSNSFPYIDMIFYNKRTNAPKKINLFIDTGSTFTIMKQNMAKEILGTSDITSLGGKERLTLGGTGTIYLHKIMGKIGNLPPRLFDVNFVQAGDIPDYENLPDAILGNDIIYPWYKLLFMRDRVMFEENPTAFGFKK